jgi:hypothetical protein
MSAGREYRRADWSLERGRKNQLRQSFVDALR